MTTLIWDVYARSYDVVATLTPYRKMVGELMGEVPDGPRRVLDAGCGTGNLTAAVRARQPAEIVAVDASEAMLERSRRKNAGVVHLRADLNGDLADVTGEFDVILCGNVLYALADPARTVALLKSRLSPGGRLVVTTPRAGAGMRAILGEHIRDRGIVSLGRVIVPLLAVGVVNARLLHSPAHHFLSRAELSAMLGTERIRTTYSGQAWLAVYEHGRAGDTAGR
ncbi:putative methyltransferase [Actinoplanes missouriensis 431]|uniref:Putative methyltransferase n=1 Tax=Actinoplanes missouriensis (strain ATCC 14538 / DSM 43046 / CBS 188.64 / JCM 3121 / NBRC 102363 / NCIMB 12654 / NRRL B-3342 / UNCC 431) TaxID=512565 RepID=I0H9A0_ACTM4|nr:methyltransferase domain-containing protein [Actinoplanes missouriensis]BAL89587.1 putative methyltransferase [Actinoplanes missouriensis 431]